MGQFRCIQPLSFLYFSWPSLLFFLEEREKVSEEKEQEEEKDNNCDFVVLFNF